MSIPTQTEYIVVGAGSAGAVVAARLAERGREVVLLEAGPEKKDKFTAIPAAFSKLFKSDLDWNYQTAAQPGLGGRSIFFPRGKVLGGSSSMNAMMWVRGFAADYDAWAQAAGDEWGYASVLEYFKRIEAVEGSNDPDHGRSGPLHVSKQRSPREYTEMFLQAVEKAGYRREPANTASPEGFTETMVNQHRGARWSTSEAYLDPARSRKNLTIVTGALARKVVLDGTRAVGVEVSHGGRTQTIRASREVILSGGAINSPQLLMLSGIGAADQLRPLGLGVVVDAPEVGANLSDHLVSMFGYRVPSGTLADAEKPLQLINYLARRRGMLTSNVAEAYGFFRSRDDLELPDLEMIYAPAPFYDEGIGEPDGHGLVAGPILVAPKSRGTVTLTSADPTAKVLVDPKYLSDPDGADRAAMLQGLRVAHTILHTEPMRSVIGDMARPRRAASTLDETVAIALEQNSHTLYHPTGTCRMGSDERSVVAPDLTVRGVTGLRVADASVMPTIVRGHTHAPSIVIGERAADLITE
ncbi:GMC family oxidoreductase [Gordonia malaquae]|uniref:GMC family oxidoreductase n=1 Tax=Gordonia malaquae TaxID=410332 RepID=UPI0030FE75E0